jgi:hypothetical protein
VRIRTWLAGLVIAGAAVTVPGVANSSIGQCPVGEMCLWGNNDYKWLIAHRDAGSMGTVVNLRGDANNEMDSWANRSSYYDVCGYGAANGGGDRQAWATLRDDNNVAPWNSDEVSSWKSVLCLGG